MLQMIWRYMVMMAIFTRPSRNESAKQKNKGLGYPLIAVHQQHSGIDILTRRLSESSKAPAEGRSLGTHDQDNVFPEEISVMPADPLTLAR